MLLLVTVLEFGLFEFQGIGRFHVSRVVKRHKEDQSMPTAVRCGADGIDHRLVPDVSCLTEPRRVWGAKHQVQYLSERMPIYLMGLAGGGVVLSYL